MSFFKSRNSLFILVAVLISSLCKFGETHLIVDPYIGDLLDHQTPSADYYAQSRDLSNSLLFDDLDDLKLNTYYAAPQESSVVQDGANLGYLIQDQPPSLDAIDTSELIDYLRQLEQNYENQQYADSNSIADINLSPLLDVLNDTISGPINDPAEFEVAFNQLTNSVSRDGQRSSNQSVISNSILPLYLGAILKELESSKAQNEVRNGAYGDLMKKEEQSEEDELAKSATSTSHYGGGEYIDFPLALIGHQYMQGGAGEGHQLLGPDGTFENVQVVKTDHAVPSYCDPPNPCPIGFTAEDGCLEEFINSASFSREYQAKQQCSCDNEHSLFNCASPVSTVRNDIYPSSQTSNDNTNSIDLDGPPSLKGSDQPGNELDNSVQGRLLEQTAKETKQNMNGKLETLARSIQNRFGNLQSVRNLIMQHQKELAKYHHEGIDDSAVKNSPRIVKKSESI